MMTFTADEQDVPVIFGIFNEVDGMLPFPVLSLAFKLPIKKKAQYHTSTTQSRQRSTELGNMHRISLEDEIRLDCRINL